MKIKVTQEDIDLGQGYAFNSQLCTVARSLKRQLPWWRHWNFVSVGATTCSWGLFPMTRKLPKNVQAFISDGLFRKSVELIEFEI